jgi:putative flippase GtrA
MKKKIKQKTSLKQIIYYLISGGAYFWTGYLVFFICDKGFHFSLWWAKLTANIIGWTVNFILQRYWVFNNKHLSSQKIQVSYRYAIITLIDFLLDYLIVRELKIIGLTPYLGQFVSAGAFTIWNYYWYKYWVFPNKPKKSTK